MSQYLCCISGKFINWINYFNYLCVQKSFYYTREVLKGMNITVCAEPCTIRIADPVVMHVA